MNNSILYDTFPITSNDLLWLAGFLEGEGSFMAGPPARPNLPLISAVTTDEDIIERVAKIFGVGYCKATRKNFKPHWKDAYRVCLNGNRAVELMKKLYPFMGIRRKQQIDEAIQSYSPRYKKLTPEIISAIKSKLSDKSITHKEIAKLFGLRRETITRINTGKLHK